MSRRPWTSSIARAGPVLGVAALLVGALTWPLLFTYSGFAGDWNHHLWLMWHQSLSIESGHFPSLFLNSSYSVFYPTYAFYGGTVYAVGGLLSLAFGGAPVQAYVLVYVLDFAAAFGGWYWLGRMADLGRWRAIVPGLVFVTSTYYVVVIYVQGDWPEFTGISMIAPMVAASLSVLRADRWRTGPALALAASSILFFGSHNITILLGLTTLALGGLAVAVFVPDARRQLTRRGAARVGAVVVPAALVSAWYLLPTLAYDSRTRLGTEYAHAREALRSSTALVSLGHLFTFSRTSGPGIPPPYYLGLSLPVLAVAWVLAGVLILPWGNAQRTWVRMLLVCSALVVVVLIAMTHAGVLLALPGPYQLIQFTYRLETYVLLLLCAAILVALVLARGSSRRARIWSWMAIPVCAVSLGGAIQQMSALPYPGQDRYTTLAYYGEVETGNNQDYLDASAPTISGAGLRSIDIPAEAVKDERVSFSIRARPGTLLATNIGGGSYLVHVTGAKPVGVSSQTGLMVLEVQSPPGGSAGSAPQETITVNTGRSLPIVLGRVLSVVGVLALVGLLLLRPAYRLITRRLAGTAGAQRDAQRQAIDGRLL
jgi:hypothetical protein